MSIWTDVLGAEIGFHDVGGVRTRVLQAGPADGRPLVLLHGRGGHLETFSRNAGPWSRGGRRVIAFDLLGHGLTAQQGRSYDVGELAAHASAVVDSLAPGDYDMVGQSLGGWLAVLIAAQRAPRHLVLIEPAGFQSNDERMMDPRVRAASEAGGKAFERATSENVALRFGQLLHDSAAVDAEMVQLRTRLYEIPGAGQVHKAVRTADNTPWLLDASSAGAPEVSLLVVRGEHGHIPAELLERVASTAGGRLVTVAHTKQWPHYEDPRDVNEIVDSFLKERAA